MAMARANTGRGYSYKIQSLQTPHRYTEVVNREVSDIPKACLEENGRAPPWPVSSY